MYIINCIIIYGISIVIRCIARWVKVTIGKYAIWLHFYTEQRLIIDRPITITFYLLQLPGLIVYLHFFQIWLYRQVVCMKKTRAKLPGRRPNSLIVILVIVPGATIIRAIYYKRVRNNIIPD